MIIARSPLRITLGGGGTDLPSYYEENEGFLISAAIDKYVYITLHDNFEDEFYLKYSDTEKTNNIKDIKHPIFREVLDYMKMDNYPLEIQSIADIPAGTGLGSSSSFTTALLKALHEYKGDIVSTRTLAEEACDIEINRLGEPIGKQDQYIAAYGGITTMKFQKDGYVWVDPLNISEETFYNLEDGLILYFTGFNRSASGILKEQNDKSKAGDKEMKANLDYVKEMGFQSKTMLEEGNLRAFADIMRIHWENKKKRSQKMSNPKIDEWYDYAMHNGALGGKLIGAGGGGLLLFYSEDKARLRGAMSKTGLKEIRFRFERQGTKIIY